MHETSLVRALIDQVGTAVKSSGDSVADAPTTVAEIIVSCGPLSGVEPLLVQQAFEILKQVTTDEHCDFSQAELTIQEEKLTAECGSCGNDFEVQDFVFRCPACQSTFVRITGGEEFRLLKIDVLTLSRETAGL